MERGDPRARAAGAKGGHAKAARRNLRPPSGGETLEGLRELDAAADVSAVLGYCVRVVLNSRASTSDRLRAASTYLRARRDEAAAADPDLIARAIADLEGETIDPADLPDHAARTTAVDPDDLPAA